MKTVEIQSQRRLLDGFFKIDEVEFRHQQRDGTMSPLLRRVHLDRGDGAAAVVVSGLDAEGKDIEVIEMPLEEVWSALDDGEIADAKTIVGLQWLRLRLLQER